jgi:hypothetical protein
MSHRFRISLLIFTVFAGLFLAWGVVQAAAALQASPGESGLAMLATPPPLPEQPAKELPDISFIDSPSASCTLPRKNTGVCLLTWSYLYVDGGSNNIITMTVGIDDKERARYDGFFQTYMYVPSEMTSFRVPCGVPGEGGNPNWGANHNYVIRARDSGGLKAANYGTATCPADSPVRNFLPLLTR